MAAVILKLLLAITVYTLVFQTVYGDNVIVYNQTFYIKPDNSSSRCPIPCLTLSEYIWKNLTSLPSSKLIFLSGEHKLDANFSIQDVDHIALEGSLYPNVLIYCIGRSGFLLREISTLRITNLSLISCGFHSVYGNLPVISLRFVQNAVLENITVSDSPAGVSVISFSSVQIVNMFCTQNTGNNSGIAIGDSDVVFLGNNTFSQNIVTVLNMKETDAGGITASYSNLTFFGNIFFFENTGVHGDYGSAVLLTLYSRVYLVGGLHFVRNSGHRSIFLANTVLFAVGTISFLDNRVGYSSQIDTILHVAESYLYLKGTFEFSRNWGSVSILNSFFWINGRMIFDANYLTRPHANGALWMFNTVANFSGEVEFFNNVAQNPLGNAGLSLLNCNNMTISGNTTFSNNTGNLRSGLLAVNTTLTVSGHFAIRNNFAHTMTAGFSMILSNCLIIGSVDISYNTARGNSNISNVFYLQESKLVLVGKHIISNNAAGHGLCVLTYRSKFTLTGNISFDNNYSELHTPHFFSNSTITFCGTTMIRNNVSPSYGGGFSVSASKLNLDGTYTFLNNTSPSGDGGGIYAIDSKISFKGSGMFLNNTAKRGGAIYLFYRSVLDFNPGLSLLFKGNAALEGGAIHIDDVVSFINCTNDRRFIDYSEPPPCFFDAGTNISNVTLKFQDNIASLGGHSLYGGMLDRCVLISPRDQTPLEFFTSISLFNSSGENFRDQNTSAISSEPFRLCYCENGQPACSLQEPTIHARRGELFSVSVIALDQLNVSIVALVRSYLISGFNDTEKILGNDGLLQKLENRCSDLQYRVWSPNDLEQLVIYADGPCKDIGNASHTFQIIFTECPIGFIFQVDSLRCVCLPRILKYTNNCNIDTGRIERPSNFWIGSTYDQNNTYSGLILYPNCPFDYCKWPSTDVIPTSPDTQCDYNRSKILCGSCSTNTSLLLGGSECSYCSNFYLVLLLPFALIGILLIACLFILKLTVATGTLHGLTFYANIVIVNQAILVPPDTFKGLSVFLSWLNLGFGIKTCFYNGMDQYAKVWLQFVFPTYLLFLVFVVIALCHFSSRAAKLFGSNPVAVLATVVLLSYTKILRNILAAFSYVTLDYPDNKQVTVWLYDGNLMYAQGRHAALFAVSIFALVLLFIPYTLILLSAHILQKSARISSYCCMKNLKPFLDAYWAPYRGTHRYWTGLFLSIRCLLLLTFAFNALGEPSINLLAIITVCFGVSSVSWLTHGIYFQRCLDALEASFILNLGIFAAATYHVRLTGGNQAAIANTSISIAFLTFAGIIFFQIYCRLRQCRSQSRSKPAATSIAGEETVDEHDADGDGIPQQDMSNVSFQVIPAPVKDLGACNATTTTIARYELREPLLDDSYARN